MDQTVVQQGMTLDEYIRRMDDDSEPRFEIINGEVVPMSPSVSGSGYMASKLMKLIWPIILSKQLGELFSEMTFVLPNADSSTWVTGSRTPDLMFISAARFSAFNDTNPGWQERPLALVPDLVIEIISPTDQMATVLKKVALYLEDGVQIVWVVNRKHQSITVYTLSDEPMVLTGDQILSGGALIPGFSTHVRVLFED